MLAACFALPLLQTWAAKPSDTVQASKRFISNSTDVATLESRPSDTSFFLIAVFATGTALRLGWLGIGLLRLRAVTRRAEPAAALSGLSADLQRDLGAQAEVLLSDDV